MNNTAPKFVTVATTAAAVEKLTKHPSGKSKEHVFDVANEDDGRQALRDFCTSGAYSTGYNWGVLMEHEGVLTVYYRMSQPCFGEISLYEADIGKLKNPSAAVKKPGDLYNPFPKGTPIAFVLPTASSLDTDYMTCLFSPEESPWRGCLKGRELLTNKDGVIGVIINDMDIDPTLMVNLFKVTRVVSLSRQHLGMKFLKDNPGQPFWKAILVAICTGNGGTASAPGYYFSKMMDTKRFATGDYVNLVEGGTIRERYSYNRPKMEYSFVNPDAPMEINPLFKDMDMYSSKVSVAEFHERLLAA